LSSLSLTFGDTTQYFLAILVQFLKIIFAENLVEQDFDVVAGRASRRRAAARPG